MSRQDKKIMKTFTLVGNPIDTSIKDINKIEKSKYEKTQKPIAGDVLKLAKIIQGKNKLRLNDLDNVQHILPKKSATSSIIDRFNHADFDEDDMKTIQQLEEKNAFQKQRIEDLENKLKILVEIKTDNDELKRQISELIRKEIDMNEEIIELRKLNESNYIENSNLKQQLSLLECDSNETIQSLREAVNQLQFEIANERDLKARLKLEHLDEIRIKDEKLANLKKQIALSFKDNSWERQMQIDELSKELKRVQETCEDLKLRLKNSTTPKKSQEYCENCLILTQQLDEKTILINPAEYQLNELVALFKKFKSLSISEKELISLITSCKKHSDPMSSLKLENSSKITKLEPITPIKRKNNFNGNK